MTPDDEPASGRFDARLLADGPAVAAQILDAAPDAMIVCDASETILLVNAQTEAVFGYARTELVGSGLERLLPESVRAQHGRHVRSYFARPVPRTMGANLELSGLHKDGRVIPVEVSLSPVQTRTGLHVCAAIRDVTDRKRVEAAAKLNAERLASAIESIEDAFALYDADDRLVLCNSAYRALMGPQLSGPLVAERFEGVLDAWIPSLDLPGEAERRRFRDQQLTGRGASRPAIDVRTHDGHSLRVMNRRTAEGGFVQTIWDLTADVQREQELQQARAAAEAASAAKTEFLSSMSHELRTPLNAVLGFAQLLQRDKKVPLADRHRERVEHILKGGEHLLGLIDEVLDLARIETGRVPLSPEPVAVADVLAEVRTTLEAMADRAGIRVVIEPAAGLPEVIADRMRFRQILLNFGSNAVKYGRAGGGVVFRASPVARGVRVVVQDDGPGIPAEKQERLFQPFYRAGQETGAIEGSGIGLALSKRLAELMGGSVGFRSHVGVGSEFWVELSVRSPSDRAPAPERLQLEQAGPGLSGSGPRHLIVYIEDNPSNIAFMHDLLDDFERVELLTAPTAEIGIEIVRARAPAVVIMDINLPGMSGLEAVRRLQEWPETAGIPVIGLSAAATPRDLERARGMGFHTYLTKPVEVGKLAAALEVLLAGEHAVGG